MSAKNILGKIFISYSWADKPFVRNLANRLEQNGYSIWLDEKELVPGDKISSKIADAIDDSRVVVIVITENSINSKWLKYELDLAISIMIEKEIRIIPILKGNIELPNQIKNLVYADFRQKSRHGYESLLNALKEEIPSAAAKTSFRLQIGYLLERAFDSKSQISMFLHSSDWRRYEVVKINDVMGFDEGLVIPYAIISTDDLSNFEQDRGFVKKSFGSDCEKIPEQYFLIIYEKSNKDHNIKTIADRISIRELDSPWIELNQFEVIVDMSGTKSLKTRENILRVTKNQIVKHASKLTKHTEA